MNCRYILGLMWVALLCSTSGAAQYTFSGACQFKNDSASTKITGTTIDYPQDTRIELLDAGGNSVAQTTLGASGGFQFAINADPADQFRIRVHLDTMRDLSLEKERINMKGRFHVLGVPVNHQWWLDSSAFAAQAADASNSLVVNLYIGHDGDADTAPASGSGTLREWSIHNWVGYDETEVTMAKLSAVMLVVDKMHRELDATGIISGWGDWADQSTHGQIILHPAGIEGLAGGFASPNGSWDIHLAYEHLNASTASHEFGHIIHYHSTSWNVLDLGDEIWGHWPWKETDTKIAYAEGWAEYVSEAFAAANGSPATYTWPFVTSATGGPYGQIWKGQDSNRTSPGDGTDNSGEIVEGAVAQIMWQLSLGSGSFVSIIEPVWEAAREGGTNTSSRNSRKSFEDFYDAFMKVNAGAGGGADRKALRDNSAERGTVYSRMQLAEYSATPGGSRQSVSDKVWVSVKSEFVAVQSDDDTLNVGTVDEEAQKAGFRYYKTGNSSPFNYTADITDAKLIAHADWTAFDSDEAADGFVGELDATIALDSKYYVIRSEVEEDEVNNVTNTETADEFLGPYLGGNDDSNKKTSEWWRDLSFIFQIKVDKVKVKLPTAGRKPVSN